MMGLPFCMAKSQPEPIPESFEEALSQLDSIVESLEGDGVPLTDLINQYDRGMKLLESCHTQLEEAKQRVTTIAATYGNESEPLAEDANDELF